MNRLVRILVCLAAAIAAVTAAIAVQHYAGWRYSNSMTGLVGAGAVWLTWLATVKNQ